MSTLAGSSRLFAGILDDAAMFPPGNAPADRAVAEHIGHGAGWYRDLVGPLLVHADRWDELLAAYEAAGANGVGVVVIGSTRRPTPVPAGLEVRGYEAVARDEGFESPGDGLPMAAEIAPEAMAADRDAQRRREAILDEIATRRAAGAALIVKLRTGGETATAFPAEPALAAVMAEAAARRIPLKYTAGLHHAVRQTEPRTGLERHGFLNLMAATKLACDGGRASDVAALLAEREADQLVCLVRAWTPTEIAGVRSAFVSFGCCGVEDPVRELVGLGLLREGATVEQAT